jgi:hypothetical protein
MGIARRKAGTVVKCPKCAGEIIVPVPEEGSPEEPGMPSDANVGAFEDPNFNPAVESAPSAPATAVEPIQQPTVEPTAPAVQLPPAPPPAPKRIGVFLSIGMIFISIIVVILLLITLFVVGLIIGIKFAAGPKKEAHQAIGWPLFSATVKNPQRNAWS